MSDAEDEDELAWLPTSPPPPPTTEQQLAQARWDEFTRLADTELPESASRWREGLAAILGIAAAALLVANAPDAASLRPGWRTAVAVVGLVAAAGAVIGLWNSLVASAGLPASISREEFEKKYGTVAHLRRTRRERASKRIGVARLTVTISLVATMLGAGLLWLAPEAAPVLRVATKDGEYCGTVRSGDQGEIHLQVAGERDARIIRYTDVENLWISDDC